MMSTLSSFVLKKRCQVSNQTKIGLNHAALARNSGLGKCTSLLASRAPERQLM
jgi:hypothetical protein